MENRGFSGLLAFRPLIASELQAIYPQQANQAGTPGSSRHSQVFLDLSLCCCCLGLACLECHVHVLLVFRAASATEVNRDEAQQVKDAPKPIVKIDNQHDPFATVVSIQYGNKLGELLDTVESQGLRFGVLSKAT